MIRVLTIAIVASALLACRPPAPLAGRAGESGDEATATHDWIFTPRGASGDLDFADGDPAEGTSLFHLSCRRNSRALSVSWTGGDEAVLTSGTATDTFRAGARVATDHPVFAALKAGGAIALGLRDADLTLSAKARGKAEVAAFFAYCDEGLDPRPAVGGAEGQGVAHALPPALTGP